MEGGLSLGSDHVLGDSLDVLCRSPASSPARISSGSTPVLRAVGQPEHESALGALSLQDEPSLRHVAAFSKLIRGHGSSTICAARDDC